MIFEIETALDVQDRIRNAARQRRLALDMTQLVLAEKSGVPLGTLKRFERTGEVSLANLLVLAEALDVLDGFSGLFPAAEALTLDDLEANDRLRQRASSKGRKV